MWMLDTSICIDAMRHRRAALQKKFLQVGVEHIAISTVVLAELYYGSARYPQRPDFRREIDTFIRPIQVVSWDGHAADAYGHIRADLERRGLVSGSNDMMIAAHALSENAILVTNNVIHFASVPGLKLENWL